LLPGRPRPQGLEDGAGLPEPEALGDPQQALHLGACEVPPHVPVAQPTPRPQGPGGPRDWGQGAPARGRKHVHRACHGVSAGDVAGCQPG